MTQPTSGRILVAGAGGFIGGHLIASLLADGLEDIWAVDIKPFDQWHQMWPTVNNLQADLSRYPEAQKAVDGCETVINLAADMGGMGFIENNRSLCMLSVLINTHLLMAARDTGVARYFFASSACVYPAALQHDANVTALREDDVYPAMPEDGYGWEKLFAERLCQNFHEDFGLATRIARYHNVFGPLGTWRGGREKAPAAICRKVAQAKLSGSGEIEIWGDGSQTRSFTFIDDCVQGTRRILAGDYGLPLNVGSNELVSVGGLVDLVEEIAGTGLRRVYLPGAPTGVRGRNSDNTRIREVLNWEPSVPLRHGLAATYRWVYDQTVEDLALR
jgi:GDP-D-mannose 3',5'-epimerase